MLELELLEPFELVGCQDPLQKHLEFWVSLLTKGTHGFFPFAGLQTLHGLGFLNVSGQFSAKLLLLVIRETQVRLNRVARDEEWPPEFVEPMLAGFFVLSSAGADKREQQNGGEGESEG